MALPADQRPLPLEDSSGRELIRIGDTRSDTAPNGGTNPVAGCLHVTLCCQQCPLVCLCVFSTCSAEDLTSSHTWGQRRGGCQPLRYEHRRQSALEACKEFLMCSAQEESLLV